MKYLVTLCLIIAALVYGWVHFGSETMASQKKPTEILSGHIVDVIDGDSLKVRTAAGVHRVELDGIDAPEIGQAFGEICADYLADLVKGREVRIEVKNTNDYGDFLGEVFLDQISINRLMLTDGYAWAKRGLFEDPTWAGLESLARSKSFGLWRDGTPTSPWEYRELIRKS